MPGVPLAARGNYSQEERVGGIVVRELQLHQQMVHPMLLAQQCEVLIKIPATQDVVVEMLQLEPPFAYVVLDYFQVLQLPAWVLLGVLGKVLEF